jgi:hypothetical protein
MTELKIVREGGTCSWIRMVVDGESKTYTRTHFPNFHPTWVYYSDNPYLPSEYHSQDQVKLENLFQEYLKEEKNE